MSWVVERVVGRLVTGRPQILRDREGARATSFGASVFPPDVADELAKLMAEMNTHILRSAILIGGDHATAALQVGRVVKEAHNESRRRFSERAELEGWLAEVATPDELTRVRAFLDER